MAILQLNDNNLMIKAKKEIRKESKQAVMALSAEQKNAQSHALCEHLQALIAEHKPQVVALFSPLPDEIDISPLAAGLECRVVMPRVGDGADGEPDMEFFDYNPQAMASGAYGIAEPQMGEPCREEDIDLMVVPGVAFSVDGVRLGRGKGYYDRYLSRDGFRAYCVGVCYGCQLRDDIPSEPHDKRVDVVIAGE